jgi:hypothetical protein
MLVTACIYKALYGSVAVFIIACNLPDGGCDGCGMGSGGDGNCFAGERDVASNVSTNLRADYYFVGRRRELEFYAAGLIGGDGVGKIQR